MAVDALSLRDVDAYYGDSHVLHGVSLTLREGTLLALLGRNGAGKSTTLRAISGLVPQTSGSIRLAGQSLIGMKTARLNV